MILQGAETFFFAGGEKGVLLIHGFTGSPAEVRLLGERLNEAGFTVLGVRLPGHGTSPEDLERMCLNDWKRAVLDGYEILRAQCAGVAVGGLSMGALLSLWLAAMRPVAAVVSLAAPVFLREEHQLVRLPERTAAKGQFLPRPRKRFSGLEERYTVCYHVMPLVSIHELLAAMAEAKAVLPEVKAPLLVVQSRKDHTVCTESGQYIYDKAGSTEKKLLLLEESGHRVTLDCEREKVMAAVKEFLCGCGRKGPED